MRKFYYNRLCPASRQRLWDCSAEPVICHREVFSDSFCLLFQRLLGLNSQAGFLLSPLHLWLVHTGWEQETGVQRWALPSVIPTAPPHPPLFPLCSWSPTKYTSNLQSPSHPVCSHFEFSVFSIFPQLGGWVRTPKALTLKWGPEFLEICISWDFWSTHTHAQTYTTHTPSAIDREDRISRVSVAHHQWMRAPCLSWKFLELITDGLWTMREKAWHEGSCDPCHSDDLAASLDPESDPAVRASGKYLCHEDKATHGSCCLFAYPHPIYSSSSVKQMFQPYICKCFWL